MAEDFGAPIPPIDEPKRNNNTIMIIVIVVLVLLCCCCAVALGAWWLWNNGDALLNYSMQVHYLLA